MGANEIMKGVRKMDKEKEKLFYIFLDIDGVLNNETYFDECFERHHVEGIMSMNCFPFDPKCLNNLMILNQKLQEKRYEVKIILTSTWRLNQVDVAIVNSRLAEYGMRIFERTLSLSSGNRGLEIKHFLNEEGIPKADNYLILDDEVKDIVNIFDPIHIINTSFQKGFCDEKLKEALFKIREEMKMDETIIQAIGRIERKFENKDKPICYDLVDKINYFENMYKTRKSYYKKNNNKIIE